MADGQPDGRRGKEDSVERRGMGCSGYSRATLSYREREAG